MKHLKTYNESVRSFLKPKPEDDVKKTLDSMKDDEKLRHIKRYKLDNLFTKEEIRNLLLNGNHMIEDLIRFLTYEPFYNALNPNDINNIKDEFKDILYDIEVPSEQLYFIEEYDHLGFFTDEEIKEIESNIKEDTYGDHVHESIRQHLKPKSEEDIENAIKNLTPNEKIIKGCENNLLWLVERGIEEGGDPNTSRSGLYDINNSAIEIAVEYDSVDVVKYLMKLPEIDLVGDNYNIIWSAVYEEHVEIIKILLDDDNVLLKSVVDGDIDHFIELVDNHFSDSKWVRDIGKRIDNIYKKK